MASFTKYFQNHTKHYFKQDQVSQQVTKSPWKIMDEKGANTFPFHNLPPELKKQSQRSFLCFFTFPFWIKEKSVATLANRNIYDKTQNPQVSYSTVSQNWRLCWGYILKVGLPQGLDHMYLLTLLDLYALHYGSMFGF